MNEDHYIINAIDYKGDRVVLTHEKLKEKAVIHSELNNNTFIKNLKQTIENPEQVWEDKDNKKRKKCYYKKYSIHSYVKAVVLTVGNPYNIISAFETNYIKETKYPHLKRLK